MRMGDFGAHRQRGKQRQRVPRLSARGRRGMLWWILALGFLAVIPPVFLHFRLRRFPKMRPRDCAWLDDPPLVCAHGGDATRATPNTVSRDLQRRTGNDSSRVGYWRKDELKRLEEVVTIEDALLMVSNAVERVILDAKVGPPFYEKGLANDLISIVQKTHCMNCIIWAKSDALVRDILRQYKDFQIGYIVMLDPSTGARSKLLRMKGADVVGVYHPLVEQKMMRTLREGGKKVYAWTVDDEPSMQRMLSEGVDGVITSRPMILQEMMRNMRTECRQGSTFW